MSKLLVSDKSVAFPVRERATAFVPEDGVPFRRATVGITYPFPDYKMHRGASHSITVFEYILEGAGEVLIDGRWQKAVAGDVYILPAGEIHEYRADTKEPWKKIWVNYVADYIKPFLAAYRITAGVYHLKEAKPLFERLLEYSDAPDTAASTAVAIADLLHRTVGMIAESLENKPADDKDEYKLRAALSARIYEKFNLDGLAAELHLSKSQIIRSFKSLYGTTPYDYFLSLKIDAAKILLRDTTMKIKEISDRLSIPDEHYFSAMFRERVGVSPREYRSKKKAEAAARAAKK